MQPDFQILFCNGKWNVIMSYGFNNLYQIHMIYFKIIRSVATILTMICLMSIKTRWFILQMNDSKLLTWMYLVLHIFVHMAYIIVISYQDYHTHIRIFLLYWLWMKATYRKMTILVVVFSLLFCVIFNHFYFFNKYYVNPHNHSITVFLQL